MEGRRPWRRVMDWVADIPAQTALDRRNAITVQLFCLALSAVMVLTLAGDAARILGRQGMGAFFRATPGTWLSLVLIAATMVLIRRASARQGFRVLCGGFVAVLATSLVVRGFHYHAYFFLRTSAIVVALPALLLGRRALWTAVAALCTGAVLGELRDRGLLGGAGPLPADMSPLGLAGAALLTTLLLAMVLDRFVSALREAFSAAIERQRALEVTAAHLTETNRELAEEAARRQRAEHLLVEAQKLEAIGRLSGGVAHDFNNLLTGISGFAELVRRELPAGTPTATDLDEIVSAARRGGELTRQLLAFARQQRIEPRLLHLEGRVQSMRKIVNRLLGDHIQLELRLAPEPWTVRMDPGQLEQVLMNLAVNARDAMPGGGRLAIITERCTVTAGESAPSPELGPGDYVRLTVRDNGVGIDEAVRARIFEPFFTTKAEGRGTGLGLATCYGIVRQAGGAIAVDSAPGRGSAFHIYLPRVPGEPDPDPQAIVPAASGGGQVVLVVEDDLFLRALVVRLLRGMGYAPLEARDPVDAEAVARAHGGPIDLLLTDVVMPGGGGRGLAEQLRAVRPEMKVLYMSGDTGVALARQDPVTPLLEKPFGPGELADKLREVFAGDARNG
jgi:signal transduction histidine kinase